MSVGVRPAKYYVSIMLSLFSQKIWRCCMYKKTIFTIKNVALLLALIFFMSVLLPINPNSTISSVNAETQYSDLMQYEWPQITGAEPAATHFSDGPAPDHPEIAWRTKITGLNSRTLVAFNGYVFAQNSSFTFALAYNTGEIVYTLPFTGQILKIDNNNMIVGNRLVDIGTGQVKWIANNTFRASPTGAYVKEEQKYYITGLTCSAWDLSDLNNQPKLIWSKDFESAGNQAGSYGDGKLFLGSYRPEVICLNANTGEILWETNLQGSPGYSGAYYMGRYFVGDLAGNMYGLNATTGEILWNYKVPNDFNFWSRWMAVGHGKVLMLNPDKYLYCFDAETGHLSWKYKGLGHFYPCNPIIADGKVYQTTGTSTYRDFTTYEPGAAEYTCLDIYTGEVLWKLPLETSSNGEGTCIAYGNLYLTPVTVSGQPNPSSVGTGHMTSQEVMCISSQSTDWPMFGKDPTHMAEGSGPTNIQVKWKFLTGGAVISSPAVVSDVVYFGSNDGNIYAVKANTGEKIWNFSTGFKVMSSPAVVGGKLYTGTDSGSLFCLDANTGTQLWKTPTGGVTFSSVNVGPIIKSSPTVISDKVYVGALDNKTYCINANNGEIIWTFDCGGPVYATPAVSEGALYIGACTPNPNGTLYKLNADTGELIWQKGLPYSERDNYRSYYASPTVPAGTGMVFTPTNAKYYYGLNATTGETIWKYQVIPGMDPTRGTEPSIASMLYSNNRVFFQDNFFLACVNATTGDLIWKTWVGREILSSPRYAFDRVYIGTEEGTFRIYNATGGNQLSFYHTGTQFWSSTALYKSKAYIGCLDNYLYCFEEKPYQDTTLYPEVTATINKMKINLGETIEVSGRINPAVANIPLNIQIIDSNSNTHDIQTTTDERGEYTVLYQPQITGTYTITTITLVDDPTSTEKSEQLTLSVIDQTQTTEPTPTPTTHPSTTPDPTILPTNQATTTPSPTSSVVNSPAITEVILPTEITYTLIAAITIAIVTAAIALVAILIIKRKT